MKDVLLKILAFISLNIILTSSENNEIFCFLNKFKDISEKYLQDVCLHDFNRNKIITEKYYLKYLNTIENDNLYNYSNGRKCIHYALGKLSKNDYLILVHASVTDEEIKIFFSIFSLENLLEKTIMVRDEVCGTLLTDYKLIFPKENNTHAELVVIDKHTPSSVEPGVSYRIDYYLLDRFISYKETQTYIGENIYVEQFGYSSYNSEIDSNKSDLISLFNTILYIPSFAKAIETLRTIPNHYLQDIFWFDPTRGHPYDYYASNKVKVKDGWLLYLIRGNKIEADSYIIYLSNKEKHPNIIHVFNGHEVEATPWNIDYNIKKGNNSFLIKTLLYSFEESSKRVKLCERDYRFKLR